MWEFVGVLIVAWVLAAGWMVVGHVRQREKQREQEEAKRIEQQLAQAEFNRKPHLKQIICGCGEVIQHHCKGERS